MRDARAWFAAVGLLGMLVAPGRAMAQGAVAFAPQVGSVADGIGMGVTPVVSADRRYVRLSIGVGSSTVDGFQSIGIPAAVGGGGGVAGGGGGGGLRSVLTGMNGPIGLGGGTPSPSPMGPDGYVYGYGVDPFGEMYAPDFGPRRQAARRPKAPRPGAGRAKKPVAGPTIAPAKDRPRAAAAPRG